MPANGFKRLNVDLSEDTYTRIDRTRRIEGITISQWVRTAIAVREDIMSLRKQGFEIIAKRSDETKTLYLPAMRRNEGEA